MGNKSIKMLSKQRGIYKGYGIFVRERQNRSYYYAIIYDDHSFNGVAGTVERDDTGGMSSVDEAFDIAQYEIDQGLFE